MLLKNEVYLLMSLKNAVLVANTVDAEKMPHAVASDLGLHCFSCMSVQIFRVYMVLRVNVTC